MLNRSRTEIVREIIETVNDFEGNGDGNGITLTRLMDEVKLSSTQLKEYLVLLTAHRFLIKPKMRRYYVTEKGQRFLEIYYKLSEMISDEEVEVAQKRKI